MKFQFKYLSLCTLSIMLFGCGGGGGSGDSGSNNATQPTPQQSQNTSKNYPEPLVDQVDSKTIGFFDYEQNGNSRTVRNDLDGTFKAMIQFAQSHTVNPNNNEKDFMPRLASEKDALLLVTPTAEMGNIEQLKAEIYKDNLLIRTIDLQDPSKIPASDQTNGDERPAVNYSKKAWSAHLNWNEIQPGLYIRIISPQQQRSGTLASNKIDFAQPSELVVQNIRLGLLTPPPNNPQKHYMLLEPEKAGTDYFQTIPVSRMIVSRYDDMKLDKVMLASGTVYDSVSQVVGDVHNGDMREDVAKSTFSVGINLANWGVTSSSMKSQEQPQLTQSVVVHHAKGNYSNGHVDHGLSGGNGMLTLLQSLDNEFSHEIGHHFGLGHYPGAQGNNKFWAEHHANSGWGYISYRNRMRGNLNWDQTDLTKINDGVSTFLNTYTYGRDAMSDGEVTSSLSKYTHYTGYSTQQNIQPALERAVWAEDSSTGYKKWNSQTRLMEVFQPKVPTSKNVWYNSSNGNYLKPKRFNVPVYTIVGGYDPDTQKGLIYPAARGNWGQVFDLPLADVSTQNASCWLSVQYSGNTQNIALASQRMDASSINKFHINLAQSDSPRRVDLYCKKANGNAVNLSTINITSGQPSQSAYVAIGQKDGFNAIRRVERPELEKELLANANQTVIKLSQNGKVLAESYKANKSDLSVNAQKQLDRYFEQENKIIRLNRWISAYKSDLSSNKVEALDAFNQFVKLLNLQSENVLAQANTIKNGTNCLKAERLSNGSYSAYVSAANGCQNNESEQWIYDLGGKIHTKLNLDQCLASVNGNIVLSECRSGSANQIWEMNSTDSAIKQSSKCFDVAGGSWNGNKASLISYGCTNNSNQKWTMLDNNQSLILAYAKNIALVQSSMNK